MKMVLPLALAGLIAACSSPDAPSEPSSEATPGASQPAPTAPAASRTGDGVLTLEGLGDLAIGKPVPADSSFSRGGEPMPGSDCRMLSSPDYPGVYALVEGGTVRRITAHEGSQVKLVEGIRVGSTEDAVLAAFPGFQSESHKYVGGRAKYLTQPGSDPRLRFEIGEDGRVSDMHIGENPQLSYVEGCS